MNLESENETQNNLSVPLPPARTRKAVGQLAHHFHGTYHFALVLAFTTPEDATSALAAELGGLGFEVSKLDARGLGVSGNSARLARIKSVLEPLRIDKCPRCKTQRHAIDDVAHSVDCGTPFEVSI